MTIRFGSVCSGIESASVAWEPLGLTPAWFSEVEKFPSAVLAHHWPHVENHGDMLKLPGMLRRGEVEAPEILVGGTPCQAFSVAGLRKGLADERGQLTIKYVEIADEIDRRRGEGNECVTVWENVPGVLSSKDNAFGCFLGALAGEDCELQPAGGRWTNAGIVYGPKRTVAWRVLDAQYFGVAQRRRRVFVVASARDGFNPAAVLFEPDGVRRDTPPSREAGTCASALTAAGVGTCGADDNQAQAGHILAQGHGSHWDSPLSPHPTLSQSGSTGGIAASDQELFAQRGSGLVLAHGQGGAEISSDYCPTLTCNHEAPIYCAPIPPAVSTGAPFSKTGSERVEAEAMIVHCSEVSPCLRSGNNYNNSDQIMESKSLIAFSGKDYGNDAIQDCSPTMRAMNGVKANGGGQLAVSYQSQVRRLTTVECARLQGFPDNHAQIPWRGKPADKCPDGPQYKAYGNSKAVPVIRWVGIRLVVELLK